MLLQLAQSSPSASTVFYVTLLFIFLTALITTVATKWSRDKCLKIFDGYRVTLERARGHTIWGTLKVFPTGIEIIYDNPFIDPRGRQKNSSLLYQAELDTQVHALLRFDPDDQEIHPDAPGGETPLGEAQFHKRMRKLRRRRLRQVRGSFNPGPIRRMWRGLRNFINTLRDAFNAAIGAAVSQMQRTSPAGGVMASQGSAVTSIGQTLVGQLANAYEPLLEQYIGQPVILDVTDPIDPNNAVVEYIGYLADYTQQFIAVMNVEHTSAEEFTVTLPDVESGDPLPPLPLPPPMGAPPPQLPKPLEVQHNLAIRMDGIRVKLQNVGYEPIAVQRLERAGVADLELKMVIPPSGTLDLPARDARAGKLVLRRMHCVDIVAPRRLATVRHAGQSLKRTGFSEEFHIDHLPLVSKLFKD